MDLRRVISLVVLIGQPELRPSTVPIRYASRQQQEPKGHSFSSSCKLTLDLVVPL